MREDDWTATLQEHPMSPFPTSDAPPRQPDAAGPDQPQRDEQSPLGTAPSYDDLLDVAVQYTFPASDPIAVQPSGKRHPEREEGGAKGPGTTPGHGNAIDL